MIKIFMCFMVIFMLAIQVQGAFGACCLPTGACQETASFQYCTSVLNGVFVTGSCTEPGICQNGGTEIPTMNEWGMIIFTVFAGLGSVYYMRRSRKES